MGFNYRLSWHYHFGRMVLSLCLIFFGYNILTQGTEFYVPLLHAWRRMLLPDSKNRINKDLTYEEAFAMVIQAEGYLFMFGGFLMFLNKRVMGGIVCMLAISFMLATQDNPMLLPYIKPAPKNNNIRLDDLTRHVSLMGAILYMMVVPPLDDAVVEDEDKKSKKNN